MRIALGLEYNGAEYCGWQTQATKRSVQSEVEAALTKIAHHPITVVAAGRTDAGVHAYAQVVHFDTHAQRLDHSWVMGGNVNLPTSIRILWAQPVAESFHAQRSAIARFYRYIIHNRPVRSALSPQLTTWCYQPLCADAMHRAAQALVGDHDFTSFRAAGCQSKSPKRIVYFIDVYRNGEQVLMDICANAFVHHMVRNIAGSLIAVGSGEKSEHWLKQVLALKDRTQAGVTAPPHGLYFGGIYYPEAFALRKHALFDRLPEGTKRFSFDKQHA
ncbi:MAG: tRNA pseudouridine(38-40) synthase TruA [Methylococcales bacterium]|nr:tRNA pseudouridine(38-40) synthase TruA [Methylococcales bacterium]